MAQATVRRQRRGSHGADANGAAPVPAPAPELVQELFPGFGERVVLPPSPEQIEAIQHDEGPALVVAAPGSGKTFIITERYLRLLEEHHLAPDNVLVLTYNNSAAAQLRDRVRDRVPPGGAEAGSLTTYNAFAVSLLSSFGWHRGWAPPHIVEDTEQDLLLLDVLRQLAPASLYDPAHPLDAVRSVRGVIQRAKQEMLTPARYHAHLRNASKRTQRNLEVATERMEGAQKDFQKELDQEGPRDPVLGPSVAVRRSSGLFERAKAQYEEARDRVVRLRVDSERQLDVARVYDRIEAEHKKRGLIDHDDCVLRAIELIRTVPECREWVRSFRYVMVDEYQDTNRAQAEMVKEVVGAKDGNVLVVADDDQSIYQFRGASRANITRFRQDFPKRVEIQLLENRRSTPEIVDVSRAVIEVALDREPKVIAAVHPSGVRPEILRAANASDEAVEIAERISRLITQGSAPEEIAILVRNRKEMDAIAVALRAANIPYIAQGGVAYFQAPEVKDAMALFSVIVAPENSLALLRCLAQPNWRLSNQARLDLNREMTRTGRSLISLLRSADSLSFLEDADRVTVARVVSRIDDLGAMALTESGSDVFWEAIRETSYFGVTQHTGDLERQQIGANLYRLADLIEGMSARGVTPGFAEAERYLRIKQAAGSEGIAPLSSEAKGVQLSTIHGSKGREWKHVFVAALTEGRLPTRLMPSALDLPDTFNPEGVGGSVNHLAEEQRLFYVAITRAMQTLTITYADRYAGGFERIEKPSQFLGSIPDSLIDRRTVTDHMLAAPKVRLLPQQMRRLPDRLSYSSLRTHDECARRYELRYVWKMPEEPQDASRLGTLVHQVLQEAFLNRMAGSPIGRRELVDLWRKVCEGPDGLTPAEQDSRMMGEGMLSRYAESTAWTNAQPSAVEQEFRVQIGPEPFTGKFDRVDKRPRITIVDYKTGVAERDLKRLRSKLQPMVYAVAASRVYGVSEVDCEFHYLRTGTISTVTYDAKQLQTARWTLGKRVEALAKSHETGRFDAKPNQRKCSQCGFRIICDEGRGLQ
jgi:DNA helicase-2/ATP-dependent DNA helicase PcrA